jgi:hypothetical protein
MTEVWSFTLMTRLRDWRWFTYRADRTRWPRIEEWRFLCFCVRCELKP